MRKRITTTILAIALFLSFAGCSFLPGNLTTLPELTTTTESSQASESTTTVTSQTTVPATTTVTSATETTTATDLVTQLRYIYDLAETSGAFEGTYDEWLETVRGPEGLPGEDGREVTFRIDANIIQWQYVGDASWIDIIDVADLTGPAGKEVTLRTFEGYIQWQYIGETAWVNLLSLTEVTGPAGADGREIILQVEGDAIQWRYTGDTTWSSLVSIDSLRGLDGEPGKEIVLQVDGNLVQWMYSDDTVWTTLLDLSALIPGQTTCTVTFDPAGGIMPTGTSLTITVPAGSSLTLPIPAMDGYVFKGWFTGTTVNDGQFFNFIPIVNDLTLTAKWADDTLNPQDHLIKFYVDGNVYEQFMKQEGTMLYEPNPPYIQGYTFDGWKMVGSTVYQLFPIEVTGPMEFLAFFTSDGLDSINIDQTFALSDTTKVKITGIITYVDSEGFHIKDDTASIYVFTDTMDITHLSDGDEVEVVGHKHISGTQPRLVDIESIDILVPDSGSGYDYLANAIGTDIPTITALPVTSYYEYGVIYKVHGDLMHFSDTGFRLLDPNGNGEIQISNQSDSAALSELWNIIGNGSEVEFIAVLHDHQTFWEVLVVPGTVAPYSGQTLIMQTIALPFLMMDYFSVEFEITSDGAIRLPEDSLNPYFKNFLFPDGTTEFTFTCWLNDNLFITLTQPIDTSTDAFHIFSWDGTNINYDLNYAGNYGSTLNDLLRYGHYVTYVDDNPDLTRVDLCWFGQLVPTNPSFSSPDYVHEGTYLDVDFITPAPSIHFVEEDITFYNDWSFAAGSIQHTVYWHMDATTTGPSIDIIYAKGYWIDENLDTAIEIAEQHGFWLEGWYLDSNLTQPMTGFQLNSDIHIYPNLIPADQKTIADIDLLDLTTEPFVSLVGTISYISTTKDGDAVLCILTDNTGSIFFFNDSQAGLPTPEVGDEVLISGDVYSSGLGNYVYATGYTLINSGTGVYLGTPEDISTDLQNGALVYLKHYYIDGTIETETLSDGSLRYSIVTATGHRFTVHSQSTYIDDNGTFVHSLADYVGVQGRLEVFYCWVAPIGDIVYAIPGSFIPD